MPGEDAISLDGLVIERLSERLVRVELANGHRLIAHAARRDQDRMARVRVGQRVRLIATPFDLSVGRLEFEQNLENEQLNQ